MTNQIAISAVYDACVLYSATLRDFLLRLAAPGFLQPYWSDKIHDEWMRNVLKNRPDLQAKQVERTRIKMDSQFPNSRIMGFEYLIPTVELPDPNDRHVLAAAIYIRAAYIVTINLRDFPQSILKQYNIEAVLPDDFAVHLINRDADIFLSLIARHRAALSRPPKTVEEYLQTLERQKLTQTVAFLRKHQPAI